MKEAVKLSSRGAEISRKLQALADEQEDFAASLSHVGFGRLSKIMFRQGESLKAQAEALRVLINDKIDEDLRNARGMSKAVIESALAGAELEKRSHEA